MTPEIAFTHVLSELSVNRKYPCEVIRELVSNSYDAEATSIEIYTLNGRKGFIFVDNGSGLSAAKTKEQSISQYCAFFSIGRTTKTKGEGIGYKCQGTKLCFAASRFAVITRTDGEAQFRIKILENPRLTLSEKTDITPVSTATPWKDLENLLSPPDKEAKNVLSLLSDSYFASMKHGTMIVVLNYEAASFENHFSVSNKAPEMSYLYNYIRSSTRHGDVRVINSTKTGFSYDAHNAFKQSAGYRDACKLSIWTGERLVEVPSGYFWLDKPDPETLSQSKTPDKITRLRDGHFFDRHAQMIEFGGRKYCLMLAVDGNGRALKEYSTLDRRGKSISGVRLTDQRGVQIACGGIKTCSFNDVLTLGRLDERYGILTSGEAQSHYLLVIEGQFDVVTNRNDLTEESVKILRDDGFIEKLRNFLDVAYNRRGSFQQLVDRLRKEAEEVQREQATQQANEQKEGVARRTRFKIRDLRQLEDKWFYAPQAGEEHWVGALYTMLSHLVPANSKYAEYWPRAITFSGRGVDALAVPSSQSTKVDDLRAVEYKFAYDGKIFNHPFSITDYIVCWKLDFPNEGKSVQDGFNCYGAVKHEEALAEIGFLIDDIQSVEGDSFAKGVVVLCLESLIKKTFSTYFTTPPPAPAIAKVSPGKTKAKGKK